MEKYLLKKGYAQLDRFMGSKDLHCHYKNNERVGDEVYIELGYGKSDNEIKELSKRGNLNFIDENGRIKSSEAFEHITQLNVQLYPDGWCTGLYIDVKGNYEYKNLVLKIADESDREKFKDLLNEILSQGYLLYLDAEEDEYNFGNADNFINSLCDNFKAEKEFYIRIVKVFNEDVKGGNKEQIINAVIDEFNKLYHLYDFMSWNTINNNYLF